LPAGARVCNGSARWKGPLAQSVEQLTFNQHDIRRKPPKTRFVWGKMWVVQNPNTPEKIRESAKNSITAQLMKHQ